MEDGTPSTQDDALRKFADFLNQNVLSVRSALRSSLTDPDISAASVADVNTIREGLQTLTEVLGDNAPRIQAEAETKQTQPKEPETKSKRRATSKAYDYLILRAIMTHGHLDYPITLDILHEMGTQLEPESKRGSLNSKLSGWKRQDILRYSNSRDVKNTSNANSFASSLQRQARGEGKEREAHRIIRERLGVDYDDPDPTTGKIDT